MLLAAVIATVIGGCAALLPEPTPTRTTETRVIGLYWVADTARGLRLFHEQTTVDARGDDVTQALTELLARRPADPDYQSLWPAGSTLRSARIEDGTVTVDLEPVQLNVGSEGEFLAIQQLLWTAAEADPAISGMRITIKGQSVESLAGHVDATGVFLLPPAYEVLAPIWVTSPAEGAVLPSGAVTVSGQARTFEANVVWELWRGNERLAQGSTTAGEAAPARAPWSVTLTIPDTGSYEVRAMEYSAKDGSLVAQDTRRFRVE